MHTKNSRRPNWLEPGHEMVGREGNIYRGNALDKQNELIGRVFGKTKYWFEERDERARKGK